MPTRPLSVRRHLQSNLLAVALLGSAVVAIPQTGAAQIGLGADVTTDATVAPVGVLRVRAFAEWTRYDALFGIPGTTGPQSLGSLFTSPSIGPAQLPLLTLADGEARSLTGSSNTTVSLGQLTTAANVRVMTAPVVIEYGVTKRLTFGVTVPLVQTRANVVAQLNPLSATSANVGPNPAAYFNNASAYAQNAQVTSGLQTAAQQLNAQLSSCKSTPGGTNCAGLLSQQGQATALVQLSNTFAATAGALYGVSAAQPGQPFIPIGGKQLEQTIDLRVDSIRQAFAAFGVFAGSGSLASAGGPAAFQQLQQVLSAPAFGIDRDTTGTASHFSLGDIELAATYQLSNTFTDSSVNAWQHRVALRAGVRLPTGQVALDNKVYDVGSGSGQPAGEGQATIDLIEGGHWVTTVSAQATIPVGYVQLTRAPYTGDALLPLNGPEPANMRAGPTGQFDLLPRYRVTPFWMITAQYTFLYQGADQLAVGDTSGTTEPFGGRSTGTEQLAGLGFSYSTVGVRGGPLAKLPAEVSFSHLEGLHGTGGPIPKYSRDQIEFRLYFGTRR